MQEMNIYGVSFDLVGKQPIVLQHSSRLGQHKIAAIAEIAGDVTPADFPPV